MTKSNLSSNLQQLMRIHGNLSVSELARLTDIPQPTIHHMLFGSTKNPRKKALEALSNYFSITVEQLVSEDELPQIIPQNVKKDLQLRTVPIIEWDMLENLPLGKTDMELKKEVFLDKNVSPNSFALIVRDSSMEPLFPLNALLIFDVGKHPQDRDFVIARLESGNNVLFNRLFTDNSEFYLKQNSEDGNVKLVKLNKDIDKIMGVLIEARIQY